MCIASHSGHIAPTGENKGSSSLRGAGHPGNSSQYSEQELADMEACIADDDELV
jgi:hypothetical protein